MLIMVLAMVGCTSDDQAAYTPKPRMYPRVVLPQPQYELTKEKSDCGFVFRKSVHALIVDRTTFFDEDLQNDCWFDLRYPALNANIHFTYYPIGADHSYQSLTNESFKMVYEHSAIASGIDELPIASAGKERGMVFSLTGPVASPYQFYLTDTTDHFLRAALYFNSRPNPDSIAPLLDYVKTDMDTLIKSFQWQ